MELIGCHYNEVNAKDCLIKIQNGIIGVYPRKNTNYLEINKPKRKMKWKFEEIDWEENKPVVPTNTQLTTWKKTYSHKIVYKTKNGDIQRILINPTIEEIIEIESQLKPWWSGKDKKFNRTLFFVLLSSLFALLTALLIYNMSNQS